MDSAVQDPIPPEEQEADETASPIYTRKAGSSNTVIEPPPPADAPTAVTEPAPSLAASPWLPDSTSPALEPEALFDLPPVGAAADLPRSTLKARWVLLVFGATLFIYLLFVNRIVLYTSPPSGDQAQYLMVAISIVQDGDLDLANNYANRDEDKFYRLAPHPPDFVGQPAPYPLPPHNGFSTARPANEMYNFHWPGLSLLVAPAWVIGGLFGLWWPATVVFMCIIGALLATNIFLFAHELTGRTWIAVAVWAALAFSNPLMSYSYLIFSELTCGLLMLYTFRRLALGWGANGPLRLLLMGLCIGFMPWVAWRTAPISFGLLVYAAVQWWRYMRVARRERTVDGDLENSEVRDQKSEVSAQSAIGHRRPSIVRLVLLWVWLLLPVGVSVVLLAWYNLFLFGSLLPDNRVPETSEPIFLWPWQGQQQLTHFMTSAYGMLFDRDFGLLVFAPVYLLAIVGIIAMFQSARRSDRRLLFAMAVVVLPYLFIILSFLFWNGLWNPPARFQTTLVPLLAAPLAFSLVACANWLYRILFGILAIWGIVMMGIFLADPRRLWPIWTSYQWLAGFGDQYSGAPPPVKIDIWSHLPAIDPPVLKAIPVNTAWITIVSIAIIVLAYAMMRRWRRAQPTRKLPVAAQGATWAIALLAVGASWYLLNFDVFQHKTKLTELQRVNANIGLRAPRGIEYMDGKIYVPDYEGGIAGVYDLAANSFTPLQVTVDGAPVAFSSPGAIQKGPDGNLYLLNNGEGVDAMLVMKPDGTLVRRIMLNGKTPISAGLQFGPDGNMYVADVRSGNIFKYSLDGGEPLDAYRGKNNGFDNIQGILVTPDGKIYAAESSTKLVQELDPSGKYVRSFALDCSPFYIANSGDWLDVTCPNVGIRSINLKTGAIQQADYASDAMAPLSVPTGAVYGPDGKLYVVDGGTLVVYKVEH